MTHVHRAIQDSQLWLWKDVATRLRDKLIAVAFWERFFAIYFETQSFYGDDSALPPPLCPVLACAPQRCAPRVLPGAVEGAAERHLHGDGEGV